MKEYFTESLFIDYFVNDSCLEVSNNEDIDSGYKLEDSISCNVFIKNVVVETFKTTKQLLFCLCM